MTAPPVTPGTKKDLRKTMVRWCIFSVLLALAPLFFNYLKVGHKASISYVDLVGKGELLLITVSLLAPPLGELIGLHTVRFNSWIDIIAGFNLLTLILVAYLYADTAANIQMSSEFEDGEYVGNISIAFYVVALISSAACKFIAGLSQYEKLPNGSVSK